MGILLRPRSDKKYLYLTTSQTMRHFPFIDEWAAFEESGQ